MSVADTSKAAYAEISYQLGPWQMQVYRLLKRVGPMNNLEIAEWLDKPINEITPRVHELREKGLVEEAYKDIGKKGKNVYYWRAIEKEQNQVIEEDCGA